MTAGRDADFSEEVLRNRYESTLANDLGNLAQRLTSMIVQYCDGVVPEAGSEGDSESELRDHCMRLVSKVFESLDSFSIEEALRETEGVIGHINRYVEQNTPWRSFKEGDHEAVHRVLYSASESLRLVAVLIHPVMPKKTEMLWLRLGWTPDDDLSGGLAWGELRPGSTVTLGSPLFPKNVVDEASN